MPCYHPLSSVDTGLKAENGKRVIKILSGREVSDWQRKQKNIVPLPCGRCIGCRLEKSRQWAVRCVHEASLHEHNCFITLTFREACPLDGTKTDPTVTLHKHHFQRFMKRLRKRFSDNKYSPIDAKYWTNPVKFYHCGEYGEQNERPHHHACLFNFDFQDKKLWSIRDGVRLYRSAELEKLWPHGHSTIGEVTFESAAYVARYVTKKITGPPAADHYKGRKPEYSTMSRGGRTGRGLAHQWFENFTDDIYPKDFIVIRGKKIKVPKYYDKSYEIKAPFDMEQIKAYRLESALSNPDNNTARLLAGELIKKQKNQMLKRQL